MHLVMCDCRFETWRVIYIWQRQFCIILIKLWKWFYSIMGLTKIFRSIWLTLLIYFFAISTVLKFWLPNQIMRAIGCMSIILCGKTFIFWAKFLEIFVRIKTNFNIISSLYIFISVLLVIYIWSDGFHSSVHYLTRNFNFKYFLFYIGESLKARSLNSFNSFRIKFAHIPFAF